MKNVTCSFFVIFVLLSTTPLFSQKIGMNTTAPLWPIHMKQAAGTTLLDNQPLLFAEYSGTNAANAIAIQGKSNPAADFGIGGDFEGGFIGAQGKVTGVGEGNYYGLFGKAGGTGEGSFLGLYGYANGAGNNVGVLGLAEGGATNWAGFFGLGNVHVQNKLGIGTLTPVSPLHVTQGAATIPSGGSVSTIEFVGTTDNINVSAVRGKAITGPGKGIGGQFIGGFVGASGSVLNTNSGDVYGLTGNANGPGTGGCTGVSGYAGGQGINYGIKAIASGGTTNWAGYFGAGNVCMENNLCVGTTNPKGSLHVTQGGNFIESYQPIASIEYTGVAVNQNSIGLQVNNKPAPGYGIGIDVDAGRVGLDVHVDAQGPESTGLFFFASGSTQFGNKGVQSLVTGGPGQNVAIHGRAPFAANSFSGFFEEGNVFIERNLGIGELNPELNLNIKDVRAKIGLTSTSASFGSFISLQNVTPGNNILGTIFFTDETNHSKGSIFYEKDHQLKMVVNGHIRMHINPNGLIGIGREPSTNRLEVEGNASKSSAGDWLANSDARLKKNMQSLDPKETMEKLLQMKGISYEWNDDKTGTARPEGTQYGFTAQNIQAVYPELVEEDANGYLQTAYSTYDAMIIESLRYLYEENKALRALLEEKSK